MDDECQAQGLSGHLSEFAVNVYEERDQQGQLHITDHDPGPEETPVVWCLEIRHNIGYKEDLCPPVSFAVRVHGVCTVPNRTRTHERKQCPTEEENKVEHWRKSEVLLQVKVADILPCQAAFCIINLKEFVRAEKATEANISLHDDSSADNYRKKNFLKEALQHPRVLRLSVHDKLRRNAELTQHKTEKFDTFKAVKLAVVPKLASGLE